MSTGLKYLSGDSVINLCPWKKCSKKGRNMRCVLGTRKTIAEFVRIWRERDGQSLDLIFNNKRKSFASSVGHGRSRKKQSLHSMLIMQLFSLDQRFALASSANIAIKIKLKNSHENVQGAKSAASSEKKGKLCYTRR